MQRTLAGGSVTGGYWPNPVLPAILAARCLKILNLSSGRATPDSRYRP
jgi:hypothetical protein